VLNKLPKIT